VVVYPITIWPDLVFGPLVLNCKDVEGSPFDLTGWDVKAHVRRPSTNLLLIDLVPVITDPLHGEITIITSQDLTDDLVYDEVAVWDCVVISPAPQLARVGPIIGGTVCIKRPVTQFA
jgi:hypothetical protein